MKNVDTRVQFTKAKLREAILELLKDKSIDKVTVKDICDKAGLNRGTFYLHYDSPAGLLKDIENQFLEENTRLFHSFLQEYREPNVVEALFASIKMHSDIVCILLGPHGDPNLAGEILDGVRDEVLNQWQREFPHYQQKDLGQHRINTKIRIIQLVPNKNCG